MSGILTAAGTGLGIAGFLRSVLGTGASAGPRMIFYNAFSPTGSDNNGTPSTQQLTDSNNQPIPVYFPPFVSLMEDRQDAMQITDHPVEQGVTISDHAYRMPSRLRMRMGWSPSSAASSGNVAIPGIGIALPTFSGLLGLSSGQGIAFVQGVYQQLLSIMAGRPLLTVVTGKRTYYNMLLESVTENTTAQTENSLLVECAFRQIILVSTSTVQTPVNSSAQGNPQQTTPTTNSGPTSTVPAPVTTENLAPLGLSYPPGSVANNTAPPLQ
jgi:hypothetical protein